jgi:hypothetical protein
MMADTQHPQERIAPVPPVIGTGEAQAMVVQLGRIADSLQQIVAELHNANVRPPVAPQPFSGNVGSSGDD